MLRSLKLSTLSGDVAFYGPASRSRLQTLEMLLQDLYQRWLESSQLTAVLVQNEGSWRLMQTIIGLLPRLDRSEPFDLTPLRSDLMQLEEVFLFRREGGEFRPCKLGELHTFDPLPRPDWQNDDEYDPPQSSGHGEMDLLAMLSVSFTINDALTLLDRLDAERLDRFMFHANELRRDPVDRTEENLAQDFSDWKEENPEIFQESLGMILKRSDIVGAGVVPTESGSG
jgi:hypothetical protein